MPRVSQDIKQNENLVLLAKLIRDGLNKSKLSKKRSAELALIKPSHLSQVLRSEKSLGKDKLIALARVLGIDYEALLSAAGYLSDDIVEIDLLESIYVRPSTISKLKVVTDPHFVDSLLFLWMFSLQPLRRFGIECELKTVDWRNVPEEMARNKYAIGFFNRKSQPRFNNQPLLDIHYWIDLCLYRGYALLTRKRARPQNIDQVNSYFVRRIKQAKISGKKLLIVAMGADTVWRLENPLNPLLLKKNFAVKSFNDADLALQRFLSGTGDFFVGGLPQRLAAGQAGCVEILNSQINPLLFSVNSLICSHQMIQKHRPLLNVASSLWFETILGLRTDSILFERASKRMLCLLEEFSIEHHSINQQIIKTCLQNGNPYEIFPTRPTDLLDEIVNVFDQVTQSVSDSKILPKILDSLHFTLNKEIIKEA